MLRTKPSPFTTGEPGDASQRTPSPPESKADDSIAEEASTSRKQGRRRWSCRSLHLLESKPNLTSRLHHTKPSSRSRRYSRCSATNDVGSFPELTTTDGPGPELRKCGQGEEAKEKHENYLNGKAKGSGDGTLAHAPDPRSDLEGLGF
ncbi:hypothetical protein DY000_02054411 [Brassica cretica]|uniref:DUF4005 domain-containing protein n=1 Tax=Brassica cretica TaxID=69181 RepID=A0ABQ7AA80_BRACR|nr:hypothetical protein DY000_02054411 [Brassica cretica]